jgi:hypothetical protein
MAFSLCRYPNYGSDSVDLLSFLVGKSPLALESGISITLAGPEVPIVSSIHHRRIAYLVVLPLLSVHIRVQNYYVVLVSHTSNPNWLSKPRNAFFITEKVN